MEACCVLTTCDRFDVAARISSKTFAGAIILQARRLHTNPFFFCFCFVSSETKRIYFNFRVNYLHSEIECPIKTEFVIGNLNVCEKQKKTCEHVN